MLGVLACMQSALGGTVAPIRQTAVHRTDTGPAQARSAPAAALVFLAREPAPYRLAWGGEAVTAMSLAQLMPTRQPDDPLPVDTASVAMSDVATPVAAPASAMPAPAPVPSRRLWLWGVLLAALGVMGTMAWLLLRPPKKA